jgi:hypothetical protein
VYLFVVWAEARHSERRILCDLAEHFRVLDVVEVQWSADETFARNLSRMYGDTLPARSDKELECGTGPFLAVVIEDERPRHGVRRTSSGMKLVNTSIFDARARYRAWTGGGYRVHASDSAAETERNLVLLFGTPTHEFRDRRPPVNGPRTHDADPVGTNGWKSTDEIVLALDAYGARVTQRSPDGNEITVQASDVWWAERIVGGNEVGPRVREVQVGGSTVELTLLEEPARGRHTLRTAIRRLRRAPLGKFRRPFEIAGDEPT